MNYPVVRIQNISKTYGKGKSFVQAVQNISFDVNKGDFLAVMGPSGSGKSTILNLIGCLDTPDCGIISYSGEDFQSKSEDELALFRNKHIGFIFQQFNLLDRFTTLRNVALPSILLGKSNSEAEEKAINLLRSVGLEKRLNHRAKELSGGEKQRVAIARALINNPLLLLADEPTGNLDSKTGEKIMHILSCLNRNGTTIVMVTHSEEIASFSNRTIRLRDSKIESITQLERSV